jgi:hypothetical protein
MVNESKFNGIVLKCTAAKGGVNVTFKEMVLVLVPTCLILGVETITHHNSLFIKVLTIPYIIPNVLLAMKREIFLWNVG